MALILAPPSKHTQMSTTYLYTPPLRAPSRVTPLLKTSQLYLLPSDQQADEMCKDNEDEVGEGQDPSVVTPVKQDV